MGTFSSFYTSGGIFMHVIAFFALCGVVALVFQVRRPALDLRVAVWGSMAMAILTGMLGVFFGLLELFTFLAGRPSIRDDLVYRGLAIAWNPILFALAVVFVLSLFALPLEISRRIRRAASEQAKSAKRAA